MEKGKKTLTIELALAGAVRLSSLDSHDPHNRWLERVGDVAVLQLMVFLHPKSALVSRIIQLTILKSIFFLRG